MGLTEICIINHNSFKRTIESNLSDFHSVLGKPLTSTEILNAYIKGSGEVFEKIRYHEGLFGTLLGYGRENSWSFLNERTHMTFFNKENPNRQVKVTFLPMFLCKEYTPETIFLKKAYSDQRTFIDQQYEKGNFFKVSLDKMCSFQ